MLFSAAATFDATSQSSVNAARAKLGLPPLNAADYSAWFQYYEKTLITLIREQNHRTSGDAGTQFSCLTNQKASFSNYDVPRLGHYTLRFVTVFAGFGFCKGEVVRAHQGIERPALALAPWISCRNWLPRTSNSRSFLSNERSHEFLMLDGESADIVAFIAERDATPLEEVAAFAATIGVADELPSFLDDLRSAGVVASGVIERAIQPDTPPRPVPLEEAENTAVELEMMEWVAGHGFLWSVFWEITYRCNEACIHCFNPGAAHHPGEKSNRQRDELTTAEGFELIDQMVEIGVFKLTISGGEATLRKDLFDLIAYARRRRLSVELYTNGQNLSDAFVDRLATLWLHRIGISLYSANPVLHDRTTRVPGSFEQSVGALRRLRDRGIKTAVKSVQMNHTVDGYELTRALGEELGGAVQLDMGLSAGVDGNLAPLDRAIDDFGKLVALAATPRGPLAVRNGRGEWARQDLVAIRRQPLCGAGRTVLNIDPSGGIAPCNSLPIKVGSSRNRGLVETWRVAQREAGTATFPDRSHRSATLAGWRGLTWADLHECGAHERCFWCRRCAGSALVENGDALGPSMSNCEQAQARLAAATLLAKGLSPSEVVALYGVCKNFGRVSSPTQELPAHEATREAGEMSFS